MNTRKLERRLKALIFYGLGAASSKIDIPLARIISTAGLRDIRRARQFFSRIDRESLTAVHLVSTSRGGSHVFGCQFHYLPCAFVFAEQYFKSFPNRDPFENHPGKLLASDFLLGSCFRENGLQAKSAERLTHLFYMHNTGIPKIEARQSNFVREIFVYHFRNPFRVLLSRRRKGERGKKSWVMTPDRVQGLFRIEAQRMQSARKAIENGSNRALIAVHEFFAAHTEAEIERIARGCGIAESCLAVDRNPREFFVSAFGSRATLEKYDGQLVCSESGRAILGAQGGFNPLSPIRLEEPVKGSMDRLIENDDLRVAREIFTERQIDFWLNDSPSVYRKIERDDLVSMYLSV